jgi:phage-related protein
MPATTVLFYREGDQVPALAWLDELRNESARRKVIRYILQLQAEGHDLRRPVAAPLRDGIYELRPSHEGVHYRVLYFFFGQGVVLLSHGLSKEDRVPDVEIDRAVRRKQVFERSPAEHAVEVEV